MSLYGHITKLQEAEGSKNLNQGITIGEVIDTNDPQQMGRLRVYCPALGDSDSSPITNIPWAMYAAPFAGANDIGQRGRGQDTTKGPVAYGMWNIPKVGSYVLLACIDGNPQYRFWFAAIYPQFLTHTMPHGRFSYRDEMGEGKPEGPMSSAEEPIQPLYNNQTAAFGDRTSHEWRTRGADSQASLLDTEFVGLKNEGEYSAVADDRGIQYTAGDGKTITSNQGYGKSRVEPDLSYKSTDGTNWDPTSHAWVTPGFHSISMEDRADNCRMRFRTTGGHQIILDDTNERIYISTAQGQTWIEIDERGTIDVYSEQDFSVHARGDINLKTDKAFRVVADEGVHITSGGETRIRSVSDIHVRTGQNLRLRAGKEMRLDSAADMHLITGAKGMFSSGGTLNLSSSANMFLSASPKIYLNGPPATNAKQAGEKEAFSVSRLPEHEPWPRVYTDKGAADKDNGNQPTPEYPYEDPNVGKGSSSRGKSFNRNPLWKR